MSHPKHETVSGGFIRHCAAPPAPQMDAIVEGCLDQNLQFTLAFGIGLHHAGLHERDRKIVEELFVKQKIQVC